MTMIAGATFAKNVSIFGWQTRNFLQFIHNAVSYSVPFFL